MFSSENVRYLLNTILLSEKYITDVSEPYVYGYLIYPYLSCLLLPAPCQLMLTGKIYHMYERLSIYAQLLWIFFRKRDRIISAGMVFGLLITGLVIAKL